MYKIPQVDAVDTDEFSEEKRMEMCEKALAIDALKDHKIKFLRKTKTGPKASYSIREKGTGRKSRPELVEAFKCPTKPSIYLQVLKKDKKETVWVIFNENEPEEVKFAEEDTGMF